MDRKQLIVERCRAVFADRFDDVLHMVRQDRQQMRGWQEPAHVRSAVRQAIQEGGTTQTETVTLVEPECGRSAGEPDRGQQREGIGQLLEAGAFGLEKIARQASPDLSAEERLGLECLLLMYGRPALLVSDGRMGNAPPFWNVLEDERDCLEMVQAGVGRIEMFGHPELDWAGTGCLVGENVLLTTRRTLELFAECRTGQWQFRPGISAWMDYRPQSGNVASARYRVRNVVGALEQYDLALLDVEPPQGQNIAPLSLAAQPPMPLENRPVYMISYPVRDSRRDEPELITRIFRDLYGVKRVQPGLMRGLMRFGDVQLMRHDCAPLGQSGGGCLVDLETHQVLGLHLYNRYLDAGTAIPLWVLREEPLFQRAGVTFTQATREDMQQTAAKLERLSRSRFWRDAQTAINELYRRAFGETSNGQRMG
jgi:hypothetical protein